jgi:hypothetical protein
MSDEMTVFTGPFTVSQTGTSGCDVRDADGNTVCWTQDRATALIIAGLLERLFQQSGN